MQSDNKDCHCPTQCHRSHHRTALLGLKRPTCPSNGRRDPSRGNWQLLATDRSAGLLQFRREMLPPSAASPKLSCAHVCADLCLRERVVVDGANVFSKLESCKKEGCANHNQD
eukprot:CAMPEP_0202815262 /NCGR_PEP_ID=MMETSP1389-20130828/6103_1 /ASSEMBLY_ACC=CAM_ASM_000865 /TAXON_ID=302021 /ORGANISM="Rhodomonas sp., Strain CCMP768" /LENGTH=112 /DNA_ID=CAMNT_0049487139 /DNA_START=404 /DNA_END=740 /DNA_ORIENTATION=-